MEGEGRVGRLQKNEMKGRHTGNSFRGHTKIREVRKDSTGHGRWGFMNLIPVRLNLTDPKKNRERNAVGIGGPYPGKPTSGKIFSRVFGAWKVRRQGA